MEVKGLCPRNVTIGQEEPLRFPTDCGRTGCWVPGVTDEARGAQKVGGNVHHQRSRNMTELTWLCTDIWKMATASRLAHSCERSWCAPAISQALVITGERAGDMCSLIECIDHHNVQWFRNPALSQTQWYTMGHICHASCRITQFTAMIRRQIWLVYH